MAGIGRASNANDKENKDKASVEELEKKFDEVKNKIRQILGDKKDRNELSDEQKNALRTEYSRAAQLAKTLSGRYTDRELSEKYDKFFKQLSDAAAKYGSVINKSVPKTTMADIKGLDNVKKLVESFMFMAQNPHLLKYYKMEGGLGMLMYGAPGTGKTMFAEAIANAMDLPLFIVTPADIFKSYVGASEQAVKQIFQEIEACPDGAILFVDECESIFSKRTSDTKDYKSAVTTELLQRINGFGVDGAKRIMIGATNRPDQIDSAYLRYKRFSHLIHVTPPDYPAKLSIIQGKLNGIPMEGITPEEVAQMTEHGTTKQTALGEEITVYDAYYSAADICGIMEETCRIALERLQAAQSSTPIPLTRDMFEAAFNKIPPSISAALLKEYEDFRKG